MSTPPTARVRDVIAAHHSNENTLFSRPGFALVICIFVSLTWALPAFGHNIPEVCKALDANPNGDPATLCGPSEDQWHRLNQEWDEFVRTHPREDFRPANTHWHMDIDEEGIGGWDKCVADGYIEAEDSYDLSNCPGEPSTDPIIPQNDPNNPPVFNGPATANVPENTPTTEVLLTVKATDSDSQDGPVTYSLGGEDVSQEDESHFSLDSTPGDPLARDLKFTIVPDYENPQDAASPYNVYVVEVTASSGTGDRYRETTKTLTITVTDVNEPPDTPNAPTVSADSGTSLLVTWSAPANEGRPPITGYNYQYKKMSDSDSPGNWTQGTASGLSVTISSLEEGISYDVQIQAKNHEGTSPWSPSGTGSTEANADPEITSDDAVDVPENTTAVLTVTAEDNDDSVTGYSIEGGADASLFSIVSSTGVLTFKTAPNFEVPQDSGRNNVYEVVVRATSGGSGRVKTVDQTISVTVTDVNEPPGTPDAPTVSADSETSLMVRWSAPPNTGPPINDYDYRYRTDSPEGSWTEVTNTTINALEVTIPNLNANTAYDVQILAKNPEGSSGWSTEGTGSTGATDPNADPRFTSSSTASVPENTTSVLTVTAVDDDTEDDIEDYKIVGGADAGRDLFSIVSSTGVLTFNTAPDYETPQDVGSNNNYVVVVRATSGTGARERTADQTISVTVTNVAESGDQGIGVTPPGDGGDDGGDDGDGGGGVVGAGITPLGSLPEDVTLSFTRTRYEASEDDEAVEFIVRLSEAVNQVVVVDYVTVSGTAMGGTDYDGTVGTLTLPAGARGRIIRVPIIDDKLVEEEETFTLRLRNSNATIGVGEATGVITDNDLQVVNVTTTQTVVEEGETVTFTVTRTGSNLTDPLRVPVRITERGDFLADGIPSTTRARFAANETTTTIELETVDDEVAEAIGAVTVTITEGDTHRVGDAASATVAVTDNDGEEPEVEVRRSDVTVSFAAARYQVSEGGGVLDFTVRLSAVSLETVTVDYATASGTAMAGQDYRATTGTLTFPILATEQRIRVPIIDDDLVEDDETFTLRLRNSNATISQGTAAGVITDNDLQVVVSIAANLPAVVEGQTAAFTLTREGDLTAPLTVPVQVTEHGAFLTDEVPTAARFAANAAIARLLVATEDDGHVEENGSVTATITSGATYQVGDAASATVAIINNDVRGVTIAPTALAIREGSSASYAVALDTEPTEDVTVTVQVPEGAEVAVDKTELTFTPANWRTHQLVAVTATQDDDTLADDPVTIRHAVSGGDYGLVFAPSVVVTILEDDATIRIVDAVASEGNGEMAFAVQLSRASSQTVAVDWMTADSTAIAGMDYEAATGTVSFPVGTTQQTIRVPIIDDDIDEAEEAFKVALRNANAEIEDGEATGVIADNDLPVVSIVADLPTVVEGGTIAFTLTRIGELSATLRVPVRITDRGSFLTDGVPTQATFAANAATTTLLVATDDDGRDEENGAVTATITSSAAYRIGDAASATVTVTDNDAPDGVTVTPTALMIREGDSASYTVVLDSEPTADATVAVVVPENAEVAIDKTELTFTAEDWNQAQTVTVTAAQDDDAIADDIVVLTHEVRGGNYDTVTAASVAVTVLEADTPALSVANAVASEGDEEMVFTVRLNLASSQTVTTAYITSSGTATAGRDYETTFGTLTFTALETEQTIRVPIIDDDIDEAAETLRVMLINASNAEIKDDKATGVITDNDVRGVTVAPTVLMIREGDSASYTVVLDSEPTADATVAVQVPGGADVSVDKTELSFTADNWNQVQTVTVTAAHDADAVADDPVTIRHAVSGGDYRSVTVASVAVTILEDDTPTLLIADGVASEGDGEMAFTVWLNVPSSQIVTVEYATADGTALAGTDYEETTGTLTFSTETTMQTIRVPIIDDDLDEVAEAFTIALSNPSNAIIEEGEATGVIADDDLPVVSVTADVETVEEGETVTFTLTRIGDLTVPLTVPVDITEHGAFLADGTPTEATFAVDAATTTLLVATDDDQRDEVDGAVTATITSGTTHRAGESNSATVLVTDNDQRGVTVTPTELTVDEGDNSSYTVVLDTEPTEDVTVTIQVPDNADIEVDQTELTFTTDNWNTPQTVQVTATHDDDAVADEPVTVAHVASGGDYGSVAVASVAVTILEDDTPTLLIADAAASEGDGEMAFSVQLNVPSSQIVTVEYATADGTALAGTDYEETTGTLTFSALETVQTIRVPIIDDDIDEAVETFTIALSNPSNATVEDGEATGVIADNDLPVVSVTADVETVEEGETVTFTLTRIGDLTIPLTVPVDITERGAFLTDGAPTQATFATDAATTTLLVATDDDQRDEADGAVTATITTGTTQRAGESNSATVLVTDNDQRGVTVTPTALTVDEGGNASYTVVLDSEPTADVTVAVQVPDNADIAVDENELTFTPDNWNTPQTVEVTADHDDDAIGDEPVTLIHAVTGGGYEGVKIADVEVTITEDDTAGVTISITALEVTEGETGQYTIVLDTQPADDVTVTIQVPDNADIEVDQTALTFTADNWNTPQTVTVTADHDDDAVTDDLLTLTHTVSGGDYEGVKIADVEITIIEDDTPGVIISITALEVTEGETGQYTIVLDTQPADDVTVTIQVPDNADIEVDQTALTFTADNWNTPQTITVTADHDDDAVDDEPVTLIHAVTGGDYEGVKIADVEVTITEDDTAEVTISITALEVTEGETGQYTIVLDTQPADDVTVTIQVPDNADVAVDQTELTFTPDNWNTPQTVTVTAAHDDDAVADDLVVLMHAVSGGDYEGVTVVDVEVTIVEDDTAGVTISITALEVPEGDSQSYTVVLDTEPAANVTVAIQVPDNADIAIDQTELTFTAEDWNQAQTVTVTAAHDDDAVTDDPVTLTHTVSGGDYEGVTAAGVEVTIVEDDTPGVVVSETALTITEGDSQSYTVVLDTQPAADVTVAVTVPEDADIAVDETTLTFTADNWNTPQTVTVTADHDDDAVVDDLVTVTHAVSGGDYEGVTAASVEVSITEDDTPALTIADANATESDEEITFTVQLNVASSLAVTVDWATTDGTATQGADYGETTGTLTFDALETEQTITVSLLDDALDETDETFTVALSNPSNATLDNAEATGTIADNDAAPALTIADAQAAEGEREITFAVTLGAVSSFEVTVDWTTADGTATADADYTAAEGRLTFAPGQTEAAIAVVVFNDALDEGTETLTVALSNPTNATIADDTATGTITDDDPSVERAWLARFGRTAASQVMDAVSDRLTGRSGQSAHLTVGGQRVTLAAASEQERAGSDRAASFSNILSQQPFYHLQRSSFADIISRSSFLLSSATSEERDTRWTAWGRGATTRFRSEETDLSLTGGPVTALLGIDRQQGRTLAGLAVAHSLGTGEFDVHTAEERFRKGELGTYLTSVHPYLRVAMTERLSAWGLLGYGRGQMERMADRADADIAMQMGGLGARGVLLSPTESSAYDVALKSDAFLVRMDADAADRPELETTMSRLRLLLEGGRPVELESGQMLPSLEVGMRHDGGDAETGLGLEMGGNLSYTHSQRGVALKATARRLLVHQASGYEEWGVGGSLNIDPGALGRGPSLRLHSSWGAAGSGMDRLWSQRSAADLAQSTQTAEAGLFDAELGYGLDALGGLLTPYARIASGRDTHTYGVGGRLRVEQSLRVDLVAERRERTTARAGHELKLRSTLYW